MRGVAPLRADTVAGQRGLDDHAGPFNRHRAEAERKLRDMTQEGRSLTTLEANDGVAEAR